MQNWADYNLGDEVIKGNGKNIKDADLALQGLDVRLGELLDKALTNTEMLTNSFAKMKDAVPKDVFDHVNGQMDKTKEIAQEITDIES